MTTTRELILIRTHTHRRLTQPSVAKLNVVLSGVVPCCYFVCWVPERTILSIVLAGWKKVYQRMEVCLNCMHPAAEKHLAVPVPVNSNNTSCVFYHTILYSKSSPFSSRSELSRENSKSDRLSPHTSGRTSQGFNFALLQ